MKAGWKRVKLGELSLIITKGATPRKGSYLEEKMVSFVRAENVGESIVSAENLKYISRELHENDLKRSRLEEGDLLITIAGAIGRTSLVDSSLLPANINQAVAVVRLDQHLVDRRFVFYFLRQQYLVSGLNAISSGQSVQANLNLKQVGNIDIDLPPLPTQRRIAAVLGALDDKIELNRKMNANLEAQAQALFKSWFVDFAPWGGKMPKEWKMGTLGEVCSKLTDGSHFSPKDDASSNIPMLSVKDMGSDDFDYSKCKHISEADFKGMSANGCVPLIDDILVAKDGSYLKSIFIVNESKRQAVLSSIAIFRPNQRVVRPEYLLNLLRQPLILEDVKRNYVSGTGVPRIVLKDFRRYPVVVPPLEVQDKINGALHEIRLMIAMNIEESRKLAETRDALLPKLMSGEVEV